MLTATSANADDRSSAVLGALARQVESWGDYRVEFSVTADGSMTRGVYTVGGDGYRIEAPGMAIVSDGTTRWEVNEVDKTIAIDTPDPDDRSVLANPTRLFDFLDGNYTHRFVGAAMVDGKSCDRLGLTDTRTDDTIEAFIDAATFRPVRLTYSLPYLDTDAVVDVLSITPHAAVDGGFVVRPSDYPDFEVIDFR